MNKTFYISIIFIFSITRLFSQATLPTYYSFDASQPPTGWTIYQTGTGAPTYGTGCDNTPACKLDGAGEYVQIFFAQTPGVVKYYLKAWTAGSSAFQGTFDVQESIDGTTWNNMSSYGNSQISVSAYQKFTNTPNSTSRYVRFYFTNKVSGWNIGLDSVTISLPGPGPNAEINIKQGTTTIPSGTVFYNNTNSTTIITIENLGTVQTLNITGANITGTNSSDFSITGLPTSISANSSANFNLNFTPSGSTGTKTATISIGNDDSDENPYLIYVYAINGTSATEPTAQPTNLTFSNIKAYTFNVSFTNASPAPDKYIVLRKKGSAITDIPVDGTTYHVGDYIGSSQVAYIGTGNTFTPLNIIANTNYYFEVFSFNGPSGYENYLTSSPLTNNQLSSGENIGSYYSGISHSSATFINDLHNKIFAHDSIYYSNYSTTILDDFESRDTAGTQKVVTCVYSGENYVYSDPFYWSVLAREHTYCKSWMPLALQNDANFLERKETSDLHNLFPTDQNNVNVIRSNYPFGEVVTVISSFLNCKYGNDANGHKVFEPRDSHKGDAARALFYMCVAYNWNLPTYISTSIQYGQDQNVLKQWHFNDPPDNWEIARNEYIFSQQHNRNPFIDSVNWVNYVDFSAVQKVENNEYFTYINIFPNPASEQLIIELSCKNVGNIDFQISDISGRVIYESKKNGYIGKNQFVFDISSLSKGIYFVKVFGKNDIKTNKLIIN